MGAVVPRPKGMLSLPFKELVQVAVHIATHLRGIVAGVALSGVDRVIHDKAILIVLRSKHDWHQWVAGRATRALMASPTSWSRGNPPHCPS